LFRRRVLLFVLSAVLILGQTGFAFADDYSQYQESLLADLMTDPVSGAEYSGYIVTVDDSDSVNRRALEKIAEEQIDDITSLVDEPKDALKFTNTDNISSIEPNYKLICFDEPAGDGTSTPAIVTPDVFPYADPADPYYTGSANYQWGLKYVNTKIAWQHGYRGKGVTIAIVDSGITNSHEDFDSRRIIEKGNYVPGARLQDDNGHGTFVTSIISARINNNATSGGLGMAGIVDEANIISYKVIDNEGVGFVSDMLQAYYDLLNSKVDVINMSFGHPGYIAREDSYVQRLIAKGVIIVSAVGNDGNKLPPVQNQIIYPAGYANVIGVGSVNSSGNISAFSTRNRTVDILAPGENMTGMSNTQSNGYKVNGKGTSYASPVVAAAAVIAKQIAPKITAKDFLDGVKATAKPNSGGIVDIGALVLRLEAKYRTHSIGTSPVKVAILISFMSNGGKVSLKNKAVFIGNKFGKLPKPTRKGYIFKGWYTAKKKGTKITSVKIVKLKKNTKLYAHWKKR